MGTHLTFQYNRAADILYINTCFPYAEQESEELDDEIIARFNPETDAIENLEILFFSTRLLRQELFQLPIAARLHRYENIKVAEERLNPGGGGLTYVGQVS